jgi:hypothetical protein
MKRASPQIKLQEFVPDLGIYSFYEILIGKVY